ncbi:MAG: 2-amino-4-hydroxy-6-hydroxymethyldihydropteridine diphosphokinase [Pseudomonadota bacterium]
METVYLGIGGNIGDVIANMDAVIRKLDALETVDVVAVSPVYKTPPWGIKEQDWFHNACVMLETGLDPDELLNECLNIETQLHRVRDVRWGPRTIDVDILVFGTRRVQTPNLTIPHPRMLERDFVLKPLSDIAPNLLLDGVSIRDALKRLKTEPLEAVDLPVNWWKA